MALNIRTDAYLRSHGKQPKGKGCWGFIQEASHGQEEKIIWVAGYLTLTEASSLLRKQLRRNGWQDANLQVAP
jgi:hypothetical protein